MAFGYGSLLVTPELGDDIPEAALAQLETAAASGAPIYPVASSLTPRGLTWGAAISACSPCPKC